MMVDFIWGNIFVGGYYYEMLFVVLLLVLSNINPLFCLYFVNIGIIFIYIKYLGNITIIL